MSRERVVYCNGKFVAESLAGISVYDTALVTGEVITEVTRTFGQRPFELQAHLQRLLAGLAELRVASPLTCDQMVTATGLTLARNLATEAEDVEWQIIYYVSRGLTQSFGLFSRADCQPTVVISCFPLVKRLGGMAHAYEQGVDLVVSSQRAIPAEILSPQIKSRGRLDYLLARLQVAEQCPGATGVLLDTQGFIVEGTGTTIYVVRDGKVLTPPGRKVLRGVTRELMFRLAAHGGVSMEEAELRVDDARGADEMFVTSTVVCLAHARSFEGTRFGDGGCGPITARLRQAVIEEVGVDYVAQARLYAARLAAINGRSRYGEVSQSNGRRRAPGRLLRPKFVP